jgi:hypothetical protein
MAVAVTGPGCIAPEIEMMKTWIKKRSKFILIAKKLVWPIDATKS